MQNPQLNIPRLYASARASNNNRADSHWYRTNIGGQESAEGSFKAGIDVEDTDGEDLVESTSGMESARALEQATKRPISTLVDDVLDSPSREPTKAATHSRTLDKRRRQLDPLSRPSGFFHSIPVPMKKQKPDSPKDTSETVPKFSYNEAVRGPRKIIEGSDECSAFWTTVDENIQDIHTRASANRLRRIIDTIPDSYPFLPDHIQRGIARNTELFECADRYRKRLNTENGIKHRIQYEQTMFAKQILTIAIRIVKCTSESHLEELDTLVQMLAKNSSALHELVRMEGRVREESAANAVEDCSLLHRNDT